MIDARYDPAVIERGWETRWIDAGLFRADEGTSRPKFSIVIPPPNVTGSLHLGHALNNTLQDILCRFKRMTGFEVLWMPGTDHAGIATQNVVERQLAQEGLTRHQLGREKFLERVWRWKESSGGAIIGQLKRLGCSCDWERERFTMDPGLSAAVRETFVRLFHDGLIYRGNYIINWCPRCASALADLEVEYPDEMEQGRLYRLLYPFADGPVGGVSGIAVDTTRPETMLGDTAVAVHPEDERYRSFVGLLLTLPLTGRKIPVIADSFVDPAFGSGAVKITPAHDPNDFEAGRRHSLPHVTVIGFDGRMTADAGGYAGLDRTQCRERIVEDLRRGGVLISVEPHLMKTGRCYRCQTVIEPLVSAQWFMRMGDLAYQAAEAVRNGRTRIVPKVWEATYFQWLENIRDWCISRQLWWGHQIPVWYCGACGEQTCAVVDPSVCAHCRSTNIRQDEDVLDTWFSSALWPFSTMGWPAETPTLKAFYPTSVLVTGFDILFFWVARMMMMGVKLTESVPFFDIYLHAMVRDEHGQKMSKTKGNVIDPLVLIDEYGADALRFTLAIMTLQGRDVNLSTARIAGYRNFLNKVWNAVRFVHLTVEANRGESFQIRSAADLPDDLSDRWIRSRLARTIRANHAAYASYDFSEVCTANYRFFWDEFCSWHLEIVKLQLKAGADRRKIVNQLLLLTEASLRLLHPVIPFVTEELWRSLPQLNGRERDLLLRAPFPTVEDFNGAIAEDDTAEREFTFVQAVISAIRTVRSEQGVPPSAAVEAVYSPAGEDRLSRTLALVSGLARLESFRVETDFSPYRTVVVEGVQIGVKLPKAAPADLARSQRERERLQQEISRLEAKLSSESFLSRAPAEVVAKERRKLEEYTDQLSVLGAREG